MKHSYFECQTMKMRKSPSYSLQRRGIKMSVLLINFIDKFLHMERHTLHSLKTSLQVSSQARASSPTLITPSRALLEQTGICKECQLVPRTFRLNLPAAPALFLTLHQ